MGVNQPLYAGVVCGEGFSLNSKESWEKNDWKGLGRIGHNRAQAVEKLAVEKEKATATELAR